jgi:hypothetical protein
MPKKIEKKIVGFRVKPADSPEAVAAPEAENTVHIAVMHEAVKRPEVLIGSTTKIKTPASDHAVYVTINDMVLNAGTEHEKRHPYEMFINCKNMESHQWTIAMTRLISAVFRKGGDITFLVEELKAVYDPKGGYFEKSKFHPSLVAKIGSVIEEHFIRVGVIVPEEMPEHVKAILAEKRAQFEGVKAVETEEEIEYPASATLCAKCNTKAVILMDGCGVCLACQDSKCG